MWKFLIKNQKIEILEREVTASDQISFVTLKFIFDGDWKKFHKVVQFTQCDETYNLVLGTDGASCLLPAELHAGTVKMSAFGYDTDNTDGLRATTIPVTLHIRSSGFIGDGTTPIPPTPDLYVQLLQKISETTKGENGKSAYEIAVENGYSGTEREWLESLKYSADLSEYAKKSDLEQEIFSVKENISYLEQSVTESIHTLNEEVTHFAQATHTHKNIANLDEITSEKIAQWDSSNSVDIAELELKIQSVQDNLLDYQLATNHRFDSMTDVTPTLESLQAQIDDITTHTHENAEILNCLTAEMIAKWNQTADQLSDTATALATNLTTMGVPSAADENLNALVSKVLEIPSSSASSVSKETLLDTSNFTSKEETLNAYGNSVFLCENSEEGFIALNSMIEKWGGISANNNYIQEESGSYGICISNWTESKGDTQILFTAPITFETGLALFEFNCCISSWMNQTLNLHFIAVSGTAQEEIISEINQKVNSGDYAYTKTFIIGGSYSLEDVLVKCEGIPVGTYYLMIDGTTKGDNSNFTYVKVSCLANL